MNHSKYAIKGVKKLFSLTKTKIRLARESNTRYTKPRPLPLVKFFSEMEVNTIDEAEKFREKLKQKVDYSNPDSTAETVFQLMDIIEGVKYKYEPEEYCTLLGEKQLKELEEKARKEKTRVNILLATEDIPEGVNIYVGENPPKNAIHLGRMPTNLAHFIDYVLKSKYFSGDKKLMNINPVLGHRTLILQAIQYSLEKKTF